MTNSSDKKQVDWLKYINTFLLSFILGLTILCFSNIATVKNVQIE